MKRLLPVLTVLLILGVFATDAHADFGLARFETSFVDADGTPVTQAGSHPYAMDTRFRLATHADEGAGAVAGQELRTLQIELPVGFVGNVTAVPQCSLVAFKTKEERPGHESATMCPDAAAVGNAGAVLFGATSAESAAVAPVYNLEPPPGAVAALGFRFALVPIIVELRIDPRSPNDVIATVRNVSQAGLVESFIELWGEPGDSTHDPYRGHCLDLNGNLELGKFASSGDCPSSATGPFLTLPRSCAEPGAISYLATSWQGAVASGSVTTPTPTGCDRLGFLPSITASPSSRATGSSTGLDFGLQVETPGLTSAGALAQSDVKDISVTLPEGFAINPSLAEGLAACSEEQLAQETPGGAAGSGCPEGAAIGTVEVETPLLGKTLDGTIYAATPYRNGAGNALLGAYVVIKDPDLGVLITQAVKIVPDPTTGRIVATSESLPQLPFSHFRLRFRSGERRPADDPADLRLLPDRRAPRPVVRRSLGRHRLDRGNRHRSRWWALSVERARVRAELRSGHGESDRRRLHAFLPPVRPAGRIGPAASRSKRPSRRRPRQAQGGGGVPGDGDRRGHRPRKAGSGEGRAGRAELSGRLGSRFGRRRRRLRGADPVSRPAYLAGPYKGAPLSCWSSPRRWSGPSTSATSSSATR